MSSNICNAWKKLNTLPPETIERMAKDPELHRYVKGLVEFDIDTTLKLYVRFMDVPGWKDNFEKIMLTNSPMMQYFFPTKG